MPHKKQVIIYDSGERYIIDEDDLYDPFPVKRELKQEDPKEKKADKEKTSQELQGV